MFSITTMSSGSEDYYIKRCSYYGLRPRKKKRSKGDPADDDSPDLDPDGAAPGFDSAEEHSIHLPGEPPGRWGGGAADFLQICPASFKKKIIAESITASIHTPANLSSRMRASLTVVLVGNAV